MREKFLEVLELQHQHSSENISAMERRGHLVRTEIAEELRGWANVFASEGSENGWRDALA